MHICSYQIFVSVKVALVTLPIMAHSLVCKDTCKLLYNCIFMVFFTAVVPFLNRSYHERIDTLPWILSAYPRTEVNYFWFFSHLSIKSFFLKTLSSLYEKSIVTLDKQLHSQIRQTTVFPKFNYPCSLRSLQVRALARIKGSQTSFCTVFSGNRNGNFSGFPNHPRICSSNPYVLT